MTLELFSTPTRPRRSENLAEDAIVLRGFAADQDEELIHEIKAAAHRAPFRNMETPGGFKMSVATTSCGTYGWTSDRSGYRYATADPITGAAWPPMPAAFTALARDASRAAGFGDFDPDACLINRYVPGARMSLHQDKNERDFAQPIVSVSLGLPAVFLFGGSARSDRTVRTRLEHGDVVVWGGTARLRYHGIKPLDPGHHHQLGSCRINLTFRVAKAR